jgi:hypothetical protein
MEINRLLLILKSSEITYILYSKGGYTDENKKNQFICSLDREKIGWPKKQMIYILAINAS